MSYIGIGPISTDNGILQRNTFAAGSGQTVFSAIYTPGYVDVYVNGIKLFNGIDFTATDGNTVVLTNGTSANDNVEIIGIQTTASNVLRNENLIINGNFDIWQRGTSLSSGTGFRYLADRWCNQSGGTTYTVSQQSFTVGQTLVPNNPSFFQRMVVTSVAGSTNFCVTGQRLENVKKLSGKTVTLSFWAKADASKYMSIEVHQNFGTGGSPSDAIQGLGIKKLALTTTWTKYVHTFTLPSIDGKVIGTDNNDFTFIVFWFDSGTSYAYRNDSLGHQSGTFDIAQVQLEEGSVVTDFENRTFEEELELCQRYYQKSYAQSVFPGTASVVGIVYTGRISYVGSNTYTASLHKIMRATPPTITFYSPDTGTASRCRGSDGTDYTVTSTNPGAGRISFSWTTTTANLVYYFHWTADAEV